MRGLGAVWRPPAASPAGLPGWAPLRVVSRSAQGWRATSWGPPRVFSDSSPEGALPPASLGPLRDDRPRPAPGAAPEYWGSSVTGFASGSSLVPAAAARASDGVLGRGRQVWLEQSARHIIGTSVPATHTFRVCVKSNQTPSVDSEIT